MNKVLLVILIVVLLLMVGAVGWLWWSGSKTTPTTTTTTTLTTPSTKSTLEKNLDAVSADLAQSTQIDSDLDTSDVDGAFDDLDPNSLSVL